MAKVKINHPYTREQLKEVIDQNTAKDLELQGFVLQFDVLTQTYRVVPWHQAGKAFADGEVAQRGGTVQFDAPAPIVKRTPQQRVDSLMLRWIEDMKRSGTVPGMHEDKIREIVGEAWKSGRTEITSEVVRTVAQHFLERADKEHEAKLDKQITRHED